MVAKEAFWPVSPGVKALKVLGALSTSCFSQSPCFACLHALLIQPCLNDLCQLISEIARLHGEKVYGSSPVAGGRHSSWARHRLICTACAWSLPLQPPNLHSPASCLLWCSLPTLPVPMATAALLPAAFVLPPSNIACTCMRAPLLPDTFHGPLISVPQFQHRQTYPSPRWSCLHTTSKIIVHSSHLHATATDHELPPSSTLHTLCHDLLQVLVSASFLQRSLAIELPYGP